MNSYDKLKLNVYESGLDFDDCVDIVNAMEACDESDTEEVFEAVLDLVEESKTSRAMRKDRKAEKKAMTIASAYKYNPTKVKVAGAASLAGTALSASGYYKLGLSAKDYTLQMKKLEKIKKEIDNCVSKLDNATTRSEQIRQESRLKRLKDELRKCESKIKSAKKQALKGAARTGAGIATNIASSQYVKHLAKGSKPVCMEATNSLDEILDTIDMI